jgi:hypothetical protein
MYGQGRHSSNAENNPEVGFRPGGDVRPLDASRFFWFLWIIHKYDSFLINFRLIIAKINWIYLFVFVALINILSFLIYNTVSFNKLLEARDNGTARNHILGILARRDRCLHRRRLGEG